MFYFTGFYGNPKHNLRYLSWDLLNRIASSHSNSNAGWLVGRDFNEILYDKEKKGGIPRAISLMNNFRNALTENFLSSLEADGPKFTWENKRKIPHLIQERLDQFVANPD